MPCRQQSHVVAVLSQAVSISPEQIATIGDMPNDSLMFKKSGLSIAMRNASPDVRQQAKHLTTSNEDEGFANAMEAFVQGEREFIGKAS
jgi:hydroxymethylpyrimidine pyrophosphatase-like HAD family hydrolase